MKRRDVLGAGLWLAAAGVAQGARAAPADLDVTPSLELAFSLKVTLGAPIEQGTYLGERRRIIPITGGTVRGPRFSGIVLPGGADWQAIRESDGNTRIFAKYAIQHDDGAVVSVENPGVRRGPADVMQRLAAGEIVDPKLYYFRASPRFDVQPGPHGWLAENTFVCAGKRWPDSVDLDFYVVL